MPQYWTPEIAAMRPLENCSLSLCVLIEGDPDQLIAPQRRQ
jgi:hypothetical protein